VQIGLEPERIRMFHMSSAMGGAFAEAAGEMIERITELGPSPLRATAEKRPSDGNARPGDGSRIYEPAIPVQDPEWSGS
jgi:hypothetical protein